MNAIVEDMLALSKISHQEIEISDVNLSELASMTINSLRESQPTREIDIKILSDLKARADVRLIGIALDNLLGNAWKSTGKTSHPRIEFGAYDSDSRRIYFVKDNGAGFDATHSNKLFEPFKRLHSESEFPGTGIGLAIVSRVVKRH